MVDKNLFLYDLAVVAIFKDEARYLKEWLDYHLLAGVEHFYLYNNDSSDNYKEVLAPYVEKNLVTLTDFPGKMMQCPAYEDAIDKYRFECRYMAFIDLDEFIFPKSNSSVVEVVDEILSKNPDAAGLRINWQIFGSNGQDKADYSKGVLERFTRRAPSDWGDYNIGGNCYIKTISNPRFIQNHFNPHYALYFGEKFAVDSANRGFISGCFNKPVCADKIVVNHYYTKSREEFELGKISKGRAYSENRSLTLKNFQEFDCNEVFDDGILKYRDTRTKNFSFESDEQRINRVINALIKILTQPSSEEINLETFLTCRAVAEKFQVSIYGQSAEELALAWIYRTLTGSEKLYRCDFEMFLKALPEILSRPFEICKKIHRLTQDNIIPLLCDHLKNDLCDNNGIDKWKARTNLLYIQKLLSLIK